MIGSLCIRLKCRHLKSIVPNTFRYASTGRGMRPTTANLVHESTLYILDGTAMLFHAFHSKEHFLQHNDASLQDCLAEELRSTLDMNMEEYNSQMHSFLSSKINTWEGNVKYAQKKVCNSKLYCGALTVMALNFSRFVRDTNPRYVAIAFDTGNKTFRNDMYSAYKENRQKPPIMLLPLFHLAPVVFQGLGAECFAMDGYEADDVMASLSRWAGQQGLDVVHVSSDKDMLQLVDSNVHVMSLQQKGKGKGSGRGRGRELMGVEHVEEKYAVPVTALVDYMAIVGDATDNIPGVRGVGPRLATALLHAFGTIDCTIAELNIPADSTMIKDGEISALVGEDAVMALDRSLKELQVRATAKKTITKLFYTGANSLRLYRTLVSLRSDLCPNDMRYTATQLPQPPLAVEHLVWSGPENSLLDVSSSLGKSLALLREHSQTRVVQDSG